MILEPFSTQTSVRAGSFGLTATVVLLASFVAGQALAGGLSDGDGQLGLQVGGAVLVKPKFEGAKSYDVVGAPIVAPAGSDGNGVVQFKGVDDLRFRLFDYAGFEAGPLVGYRFDRDESDAATLNGLGDVDGGVVAGGFVAYRMGLVKPFLSYHHQVTGDDTGGIARLGVEARIPVFDRFKLTATGGVTWADDDYMQSFFGVTALQSAASGLAAFNAEAGVKDVFFGISADVPVTDRWSVKLSGRYTHLVGDAADSPIVETESQWQGGVGLTYRFSIAR